MLRSPAILRYFWKTDLTICIPAFEAASFIDRSLRCAQRQTYNRLRILVSVDKSIDDTASICRAFAKEDARIEVIQHQERLGWCGNVNSLLERADTPFFFVYFHDDIIRPQYCWQLRGALLRNPAAASVHCDLLEFGSAHRLRPARRYKGSIATRLLTLFAVKERGTPLRSVIRQSMIGSDYRLPNDGETEMSPGLILLMHMMAAGPAVAVSETLYLRWKRQGGLTASWRQLPFEMIVQGWQKELARTFLLVEEKVDGSDDQNVVKFALILHALRQLSARCRVEGRPLLLGTDLHPNAPDLRVPDNVERFGSEIATHLRKRAEKIAGEWNT
jgi:hypothetical protein